MNSRFVQPPHNLKDRETGYARKKEKKCKCQQQTKTKAKENKGGQALLSLSALSSLLIIVFHVSKTTTEISTKSLPVRPEDPTDTEDM